MTDALYTHDVAIMAREPDRRHRARGTEPRCRGRPVRQFDSKPKTGFDPPIIAGMNDDLGR
jgi:hypothetical protein